MAGNGGIIGPVNTVTSSIPETITTFNASGTLTTQSTTSKVRALVVVVHLPKDVMFTGPIIPPFCAII